MSDTKINVGWSVGFLEALALIFITLKLTKVINWSWWFVLMPIWLPLLIFFVVCVILLIVWLIMEFKK